MPLLLIAGCSMASPGVASLGNSTQYGAAPTAYNNKWVQKEESKTHTLPELKDWSVDVSNREIGVSPWFDSDGNPTAPRKPGWQQRQEERQAARKAEWRERMGITNIKDEQRARQEEQKSAASE